MNKSKKHIEQAAEQTLPFYFAKKKESEAEAHFKSKVKLPDDATASVVTRAVDTIVRSQMKTTCIKTSKQAGDSKCKCKAAQATATLIPSEREFVVEVVKEYRAWLAKEERAKLRKAAAVEAKNPIDAVLEMK